jgi:4-amino-4-deoxy-L-arabinose transferase-like glycosyltransferase
VFSLRGKEDRTGFSPVNYLLLIYIFAVVWRVIQLVHYKVIGTDSAYYGSVARFFAEGYWERALDPYWSPFYPFLVSLPFRLGISLEASGIAVSLLASAGSVIVCFFLAKLVAGTRVGLIAAAIAAIHPRLVIMSQTFLTESLYLFLACGALALFCYALDSSTLKKKKTRIIIFFFIGILLSLSYLTRPEGILYFALLFVLCIASLILKRSFTKSVSLKASSWNYVLPFIMLLGFVATSFPYLHNVARIEGGLSLGEKGSWNFYGAYRNDYKQAGITVTRADHDYITGPEQSRKPGNYHMFEFLRRRPGLVIKRTFQNIPIALLDKIPSLMYWPLILISLFGIFYRKKVPRSSYENIYVIWILIPVIIYSPLFLYRRFFVITLPLLIVFCAIGVEEMRHLMSRKFFSIFMSICVVLLLIYTNFSISSEPKPILYKEGGLWLKKNATKHLVVSGRKPELSFYAEAEFYPLKAKRIDDLQDFLAEESVTHLVVEDYILPRSHPGLASLLDPENAPPWLHQVYASTAKGHKLIIYEFSPD